MIDVLGAVVFSRSDLIDGPVLAWTRSRAQNGAVLTVRQEICIGVSLQLRGYAVLGRIEKRPKFFLT